MKDLRRGRYDRPVPTTALALALLLSPPSDAAQRPESATGGAAPIGMAWIAGGEFTMGTDDPRSFPNERPAHRVKVDGFWMD